MRKRAVDHRRQLSRLRRQQVHGAEQVHGRAVGASGAKQHVLWRLRARRRSRKADERERTKQTEAKFYHIHMTTGRRHLSPIVRMRLAARQRKMVRRMMVALREQTGEPQTPNL